MRPRGKRFSLGAAVFGWPPAPGYAAPTQFAPELFVEQLIKQHAGPALLRGIFQTCKAGRDAVLQNAAEARVLLAPCTDQAEPAQAGSSAAAAAASEGIQLGTGAALAAEGRLIAVSESLGLRSKGAPTSQKPNTTLVLLIDGGEPSVRAVRKLPGLLLAEQASLTAVGLVPFDPRRIPHLSTLKTFLHSPAFTNITTLFMGPFGVALPAPAEMPNLVQLVVGASGLGMGSGRPEPLCEAPARKPIDHALTRSVKAYLPQLKYLSLKGFDWTWFEWDRIFGEDSTSKTLTRFETDAMLHLYLVGQLLDHAPSLTDLTVSHIDLTPPEDWDWDEDEGSDNGFCEDYSEKEWGLQRLTQTDRQPKELPFLDQLQRLPKTAVGQLRLGVSCGRPLAMETHGWLGFQWYILDRLFQWQFNNCTINLQFDPYHPDFTEEGIRNLTNHLAHLVAPPPTSIQLTDWPWDRTMVTQFIDALPTLSHLSFSCVKHSLNEKPFTDALLGCMLRLAPHVPRLSVRSLSGLQTEQHAGKAWPWGDGGLEVEMVNVGCVCRLPDPGVGLVRVVKCESACVDYETIAKVGAVATKRRLSRLSFTWDKAITIKLPWSGNATHTKTQLSVLRAVQWDHAKPIGIDMVLVLDRWPMSTETMALLRDLPAYECVLDLRTCTWPAADAAVYVGVAKHAPAGFAEWWVPKSAPRAVRDALCAGINARQARVKAREERVGVYWCAKQYAKVHEDVGEHVRVWDHSAEDLAK